MTVSQFFILEDLQNHELGLNWYQIRSKTYYIPKVSKFSVKKDISVDTLEISFLNAYFTDQNIKQRRGQ